MGWFSRATGGIFDSAVNTVREAISDAKDFVEESTNMQIEQIGLVVAAAVVTVATGGLATEVGVALLGPELAGEAIVGSATVGSVTGGTVIGAGTGALSGVGQAALVGGDLLDGALKGLVVGAVSGGVGMLSAGAVSSALYNSLANHSLKPLLCRW